MNLFASTFDPRKQRPPLPVLRSAPPVLRPTPPPSTPELAADRGAALAAAYRRHGGLASSDEVLRLMRPHADQAISRLARWIVTRRAISFTWHSCTFLPMFQFERADMSLKRAPNAIACELRAAFDEWDLAWWFVQPNSWLQDAAPIERIAADPESVLQAARADRFIALG